MFKAQESSLLSLRTLKEETQSSELRLQEQLKKTNCFFLPHGSCMDYNNLFTKLIILQI